MSDRPVQTAFSWPTETRGDRLAEHQDLVNWAESIGVEGELNSLPDSEIIERVRVVMAERRAARAAAEGGAE